MTLPDQAARELIASRLDLNLLVEAGAGSGKTENLAQRMAAGITEGVYEIEAMAAVTFTRKAAAELRGRFQQTLEARLVDEPVPEKAARIRAALALLERLFAGTIHAFCARLLRERPVEAGIAPGFTELDEIADLEQQQQSWREYLSRERARGSGTLRALEAAGVQPKDLDDEFARVCLFEEVEFPSGDATPPDPDPAWRALEAMWADLGPRVPEELPADTRCDVQKRAKDFRWRLRAARSRRPADLTALLTIWDHTPRVTMKWWEGLTPNTRVLRDELQELLGRFRDDIVTPYLTEWRRYVYDLAIELLVDARDYARDLRFSRLALNYGDLLQRAAKLLREQPDVRRALQGKYRWLFVDEFQDTDPIQAEVLLLLAAHETEKRKPARRVDWTRVRPRPGALFVVGDPKQSIFRFRRADIEIYDQVRRIIEASGGQTVPLEASFRAVPALCAWANEVFATVFPDAPTPPQPAFHRLEPVRADAPAAGVRVLRHEASVDRSELAGEDAARIADYVRSEIAAGRRRPGDFLILTRIKRNLAVYAAALERLDLPVEVSGAGAFGDSEHVRELAALLRSLADPDDGVALVGVLRGPFFGISDEQLFRYRQAGGSFTLTRPVIGDPVESSPEAIPPPPPPARAHRQSDAGQPNLFEVPDEPSRPAAESALVELQAMYRWTRQLPAAAATERILERTGFLALAATGTPGGADAGDLIHAVDRVRQVAEDGGTLAEAAAALTREIEGSDVESLPLEPGRSDVVRVMNLHKAKGLEAPVVFLADPGTSGGSRGVGLRIERDGDRAVGFLRFVRRRNFAETVLGEPDGWADRAAAERQFLDCEEDRLRYVAATRAMDLLVVSCWERATAKKPGPWTAFDAALAGAEALEVGETTVPVAVAPSSAAGDLAATAEAAASERQARLRRAATPAWAVESVTGGERHEITVREDDPARLLRGPATGMEWGELVHRLLEDALRRGEVDTARLTRLAKWLTFGKSELATVIHEAVEAVETITESDLWRDALAAETRHVEVPFAVLEDAAEGDSTDGLPTVCHGVIDLVYRTADGWAIVDHKTDQLCEGGTEALADRYRGQLERYVDAWRAVTGDVRVTTGLHVVRAGEIRWTS
ncbi:MAG: UvrD-helicase domain-containing protein [Vicinamibacterales bacterium]|jgi:ATP-dependent helicase/nuclease subunit A|nr:UvrD-helicase domain-containing protein [Vicinamibacterales bacterium]